MLTTVLVVQCSVTCGDGVQSRDVSCAHEGLCDEEQRPVDRRLCDTGPCWHWVTGPWGEVSYVRWFYFSVALVCHLYLL